MAALHNERRLEAELKQCAADLDRATAKPESGRRWWRGLAWAGAGAAVVGAFVAGAVVL